MSIINKLKNTALSLAIKLDMPATVKYLIKDNTELVTDKVLFSAVSTGNVECLSEILNVSPITKSNVNLVVNALEKTQEGKYSETLNTLLSSNLIQPETDFSKFLGIHCKKTANLDFEDKVYLFSIIGHTYGEFGEYKPSSSEVAKAVKENIQFIDYDMADQLIKRGYLKDEGAIYKDEIIAGTSNALMSLCGVAANADNIHFINAWLSHGYDFNTNDAIATQDLAARANSKMLCAEKIVEQKAANPEMSLNEIRKNVEKEHYATVNITNFAVADGDKFDKNKGNVLEHKIPLLYLKTPGLSGKNPENEFSNVWYNYNLQELKTIAEISSVLVNKQEREMSPEMKKEIESVLVTREKLYKEMFSENSKNLAREQEDLNMVLNFKNKQIPNGINLNELAQNKVILEQFNKPKP